MSETPFATFNPNAMALEKSRELEWLIPNRLGGYSASTIFDLPTNSYHALLVSGCDNLKRRVYLEGLEEEIHLPERAIGLKGPGYGGPGKFDFNHNSVSYYHYFDEFSLTKTINPASDKNGVVVLYTAENKNPTPLKIRVKVLANSRNVESLGTAENQFQPKLFTDKILGVGSELGYLTIYSDKATCRENEGERWNSFCYSNNKENFHYIPAFFELSVDGNSTQDFTLSALAYETEEKTADAFKDLSQMKEKKSRIFSSDMGSSIFALLKIAETFVVDIDSKKSIISYPFSGENVREAMIALPGLTLINGRFDDAEPVFERILNNSARNGVPGSIIDGEPIHDSIDTTLWLIDRLYKYGKAAGMERLKGLLHTYWWDMKDMVKGYIDMEKDGLLMHKGGTWMPNRDNAVEVQGLWYNSLRIMEKLSELMDDKETDFRGIYLAFGENFLEEFWNGSYLKDTLDDDSLGPNQLIALTLEFSPLNETLQKKVLNSLEELVTVVGIRTLDPKSENYNPDDRFNGAVFPWLLGPYIKLLMRVSDKRLHAKGVLENIFENHTREAGIGTISEFFSGENLKSAGNISHAPAVGELTRAYFEDVMGREQQPPAQGIPQRS